MLPPHRYIKKFLMRGVIYSSADFYLMKVAQITNIMNISLLKRKRLFHRQANPNHLTVVSS